MEDNKNLEMETMENEVGFYEDSETECSEESSSGIGGKLILAGAAALATAGVVAYKKLKAKKDGKPKVKKRLRWVAVEDEDIDAMEEDIVDIDDDVEPEESETK